MCFSVNARPRGKQGHYSNNVFNVNAIRWHYHQLTRVLSNKRTFIYIAAKCVMEYAITRYPVLQLCYHISASNNSYPRLRDSIKPSSLFVALYLIVYIFLHLEILIVRYRNIFPIFLNVDSSLSTFDKIIIFIRGWYRSQNETAEYQY